jgi:hypothetical protein
MKTTRRILCAIGGALASLHCGGNERVIGRSPVGPPRWDTQCRIEGSDVSCTLMDNDRADLTDEATWSVDGPATVTAPGRIHATGRGEIVIRAFFRFFSEGGTREVSRFLVDPPAVARRLWWMSGSVVDAVDDRPIAGANAMILDGYNAGRSALTDDRGRYRIDPLLTGEEFTLEVSAQGFRTLTRRYEVRDPVGRIDTPGESGLLDVRLTRVPSP